MPILTLVRHGQASFGAADYDQLSPLGAQQALRLGEYFKAKNQSFDAVYRGSLRRHEQTLAGILQGMTIEIAPSAPIAPIVRAGLNEYDSDAILAAIHPEPLSTERNAETYRQHFRLLRQGLDAWMQGRAQPRGMPSYAQFVQGITDVLDEIRTHWGSQENANILLVSSGGPISTIVGQILGTAPQTTIELNFRIRNASLSELHFNPKRYMLQSYNHLPHLEQPEWLTYA